MACNLLFSGLARTFGKLLSESVLRYELLAVICLSLLLQTGRNEARDFVCPDREVEFDMSLKAMMDQSELIFTGIVEEINAIEKGPVHGQIVTARIKSVFKGDKINEDSITIIIVDGQFPSWLHPLPLNWLRRSKGSWCFSFDDLKLRDSRIFTVASARSFPASSVANKIAVAPPLLVSAFLLTKLRLLTTGTEAPVDSRPVPAAPTASSISSTAVAISIAKEDKADPCIDLKCPPGAKCLPSSDGNSATCHCPARCPNYGDSTGSRPLCGVDGRDYANLCELQRTACTTNRNIEIKFQGLCDPCSSMECSPPSVCVLDVDRRPHCRCGAQCSSEFQPVCGSDGRSYSSQCHLLQEACRTQRNLRILYKGLCESGVHPCSTAGCQSDEECQVDENGLAQCLCPGPCPPIHRPVCGSDKRTYSSQCELERESCLQKRNLSLHYEGICGSSQVCMHFRCPPGGYCAENADGEATCHCPSCGGEWDPVCGSDGVTYANPCRLRYESCTRNKSLSVVYKGLCNLIDDMNHADGCDKKRCDFYATCENDEMGRAQCVCPKGCSKLAKAEVCGTDGITYRNDCELKLAACTKQQFIVVASPGDCDLCKNVQCQHGARCEGGSCVCPTQCPEAHSSSSASVCANDGRTYLTQCHMQKAACDHAIELQMIHPGPCPTTAADLILAPFESHTIISSLDDQSNHANRKCNCHPHGSIDDQCDPVTLQCRCHPGVGGRSCDRCLSGFWGLHFIGTNRCEACECHPLGSIRDDCEQMTGRCVCRSHVVGLKCDRCEDGQLIDSVPEGCVGSMGTGNQDTSEHESRHCSDLTCRFGAICQDLQGQAVCVCPMDCPLSSASSSHMTVCGSDGISYGSECDLRLAACRKQISLSMAYEGPCSEEMVLPKAADGVESDMAVSKATRHVQTAEVAQLDWGRRDVVPLSQIGSITNQYEYSQPIWKSTVPTASTIRIRGHLGDPCTEDGQCLSTANSLCIQGICSCADGFAENSDQRYCVANVPLSPETFGSSCESSPCLGGGTCQPLGVESFVCLCPPERVGSLCERALTESDEEINPSETPAFHGQSFVELKKMKARDKFGLEMEFKSLLSDGILLFAQQRKGSATDFIALVIVAGYVELRFNLGNGPVVLRSVQPIRLGHWHRIMAQRYRQDGWLRLDDDEDMAITSPGIHSSLDIDTNTFLGAVPPHLATGRVYEKIGTASGFVGCMRRVKLGRRAVNFHVPAEGRKAPRRTERHFPEERSRSNSIDSFGPVPPKRSKSSANKSTAPTIIKLSGITQCGENPCWKTPCANNGTCVWRSGYNFTCTCKPGFTGKHCETVIDPCASGPCADGSTCFSSNQQFICKCPPGKKGLLCNQHDTLKHEILVPEFSIQPSTVSSYIAINRSFQISHNFDLEVWFLSRSSDGILAYASQDTNGRGDFVWLALIGGRAQFRWDLGSGAGIVTSSERVSLYNWHRVLVSRRGREASIRLDEGPTNQGRSSGPLSELNIDTPLFIGGLRSNLALSRDIPRLSNLQGAVQRVIVNGEVLDKLMENDEQENVSVYRGPPCGHMPITHQTSSRSASQSRESSTPCLNGGICQPLLANYICKCQSGFLGKRCEKRIDESDGPRTVRFDGKTFLKFPNQLKDVPNQTYHWLPYAWTNANSTDFIYDLASENTNPTVVYEDSNDERDESTKSQRYNRFELGLRTTSENGLILWLSRGHSLQADYFALALVHSHLELSFNLGKQTAFLTARSAVNVSDGQWHTVLVERKKRLGIIQVDGETAVRVTADPGATILNSNGKLWIGGTANLPSGLPSPYYEGFTGCIDHVKVDRHNLDWHRHGDNAILHFCDES